MQTVQSMLKQNEELEYWTDLWFNNYKRAGYVATTYNFRKHYFFGNNDIEKLIKFTENKYKQFISINAFEVDWQNKEFSRSTEKLKQIRNIAVDIDQYNNDLTIKETLDEIQAMILSKKLPEPNLVLTSRGIQLFYSIDKGASPEMGWLVSYITEQFISKLHFLGADYNAKDLSRVMRVPNSINERNKVKVNAEIWNNKAYTLEELQLYCKPLELFETRRKKMFMHIPKTKSSINIRIMRFYRTNHARLSDLRKLILLRKGNFTRCRNVFIYVLAYHQSLILNTKTDVIASVMADIRGIYTTETGKKAEKMTKSWLEKTIKSAYDDAKKFFEHFKDNGYYMIYKQNDGIIKPYKTSKLIDKLNITIEEQRQLKSIRNQDIAKEQHAEYMRNKRRKDGVQSREEYDKNREDNKNILMNKVAKLREKGLSYAKIGEELNISKTRAIQLTKEYKGVNGV